MIKKLPVSEKTLIIVVGIIAFSIIASVYILTSTERHETFPTTTTRPTTTQPKETLTTNEMKSIVYQAIRKHIPESTISGYEHESRTYQRCGDYWYYPQKEDWSKHVIFATIQVCNLNDAYTPEYILSISSGYSPGEIYIKNLENGKILVIDKKVEFSYGGGRYDFTVQFPCQNRYYITIATTDFYGEDIWSIYKDYDIDKVSIENMVNEILGHCS